MGNQTSNELITQKKEEEDTVTVPWSYVNAISHILDDFDEGATYSFGGDGNLSSSSQQHTRQDPAELAPWLYLTSEFKVRQYTRQYISKGNPLGITHVLSTNGMSTESKASLQRSVANAGMTHRMVSGEDEEDYDMIQNHWEECLAFLKTVKEENGDRQGKVVIHCVAGVNRSGLIATAALIVLERMPLLDAVRLVKAKRGYVLSNFYFRQQLACLAAKEGLLGDKPSGYPDECPVEQKVRPSKKVAGLLMNRFG